MPIGRNDPCPCGSGKKFKKCHGVLRSAATERGAEAARPDAARARALKTVDVDLGKRLLAFARAQYGRGWLADIADVYCDVEGGEIPDTEMALAIPWGLFCVPTSDEITVAEAWRRERGSRLTPDQRLLIDAYASMWLSIWEVVEVERGVGTKLVDLLTREERFVYDVQSSTTLERLQAVLAFVLDCDGVSFFGGVHGQPLPPRQSASAVDEARRLCRIRTRPASLDKLRDPAMQLDLIDSWNFEVDRMLMQPPPSLQNTDGDPVEMTTDDYELVAPRADVARALESMDGAGEPEEENGELVFAITKPGNAMHATWSNTVLARAVLGTRRLAVESNSTRRADAVRGKLEAHLGPMIRFRLRSAANTRDMMERARASAATPGGARPRAAPEPPEAAAIIREYMQQHMKNWLDMTIPALGGHTPREAASMRKWRGKLELLLKQLEYEDSRKRPEERSDVAALRRELGLA